jgi:putative ABC transport system permease protein
MVAVVGSSFKSTFSGLLDNSVEADFFVRPSNFTDLGFSPDLTNALRARPEIESVLPFRFAPQSGRVEGKTKDLGGTNFGDLLQHLNPHVITGDVATASPDSILIHKDSAKDLGLKVGDTIDLTFIDQKVETLKVAAIYDDASILGNWVISLETWDKHFSAGLDQFVTVRSADRTDITAAAKAVEEETAKFPQVKAENREEFKKTQAATIDTFLTIINVMLGFSILVALLGIYNTLRLSIYERTRELGLLRAVGMARSQMRVMIRWEAAIVAVFGAVLGVVLGVLFGFAAASAMPSSFIKSVTIPYGSLFGYVVFAAVAGLIAAILPARRAARLNVLDAISHT